MSPSRNWIPAGGVLWWWILSTCMERSLPSHILSCPSLHQLQSPSSCSFICSIESFNFRLETHQKLPACSSFFFIFLKMGIWLFNALMFAGVALQDTVMPGSGTDGSLVRYMRYRERYCGIHSKPSSTSTQDGKIQTCVNTQLWNHVCSYRHQEDITGKACDDRLTSYSENISLWKPWQFAMVLCWNKNHFTIFHDDIWGAPNGP